MKKSKFIILFALITFSKIMFSQKQVSYDFTFCKSNDNRIYLDSLSKCAELFSSDKSIKISSYNVSYELPESKIPKKFTVWGSVFNKALLEDLNTNKKHVNMVTIDNVMGEKDGKPIKLASRKFMFFF